MIRKGGMLRAGSSTTGDATSRACRTGDSHPNSISMMNKNKVPLGFGMLALAGSAVMLIAVYVQEGDHTPTTIFLAVSFLTTVLTMSTSFFLAKALFKKWLTDKPKGGWWRGALIESGSDPTFFCYARQNRRSTNDRRIETCTTYSCLFTW